jgi:hypothetical protein
VGQALHRVREGIRCRKPATAQQHARDEGEDQQPWAAAVAVVRAVRSGLAHHRCKRSRGAWRYGPAMGEASVRREAPSVIDAPECAPHHSAVAAEARINTIRPTSDRSAAAQAAAVLHGLPRNGFLSAAGNEVLVEQSGLGSELQRRWKRPVDLDCSLFVAYVGEVAAGTIAARWHDDGTAEPQADVRARIANRACR